MSARYEIIRDFEGNCHFELRSGASLPLLTGGKRTSLALCRGSIASARIICDAPLEDVRGYTGTATDVLKFPKYRFERMPSGRYTFSLWAKNGKKLAVGPACATISAALDALAAARREARYSPTSEKIFEI
jgi:uncharacterized protein YegP (UPF0339 family)